MHLKFSVFRGPMPWLALGIFIGLIFGCGRLGFAQDASSRLPVSIEPIPSLIQTIRFKEEIMFCGQPVPHHRQEVRQALEKEILLSLWNRPQVILWLKRGAKFFPHIEAILKEENLPLDLKYVPIVESALRPHAKSTASAVGYWQFVRSTGKRYGLAINRRLDERRNIFKSTRAACKYIHKLYDETKSYPTALAGYNMGEYGLMDEIKSQKTRDYFSLYLPLETQRYVYKIIAAKLIMENPASYGFVLEPEDLYPVFSFSKLDFNSKRNVPLQMIAEAAGISFKRLKEFNPDIRGYQLPKGKMTVLVPRGRNRGFKERFNRLYAAWARTPEKKVNRVAKASKKKKKYRYYRVRSGDTLSGIARKHRLSLKKLLKMNRFSSKKVIRPGDRVQIR